MDRLISKGGQHAAPPLRRIDCFEAGREDYFSGIQQIFGERAVHPMGAAEQRGMERAARRAAEARRRLEKRRAYIWRMAADTAVAAAGGFALIAVQGLAAGRFVRFLLAAALALAMWVLAGVVRGDGS